MLGWKLHNEGQLLPGAVVMPQERLSWGRTVGLGAQHVVAMFGATFVFPVLMGLNPQLAIMMSGIATLVFLFAVNHRVPSYLGSSASFVGVAFAIKGMGGNPATLTGALFVMGLTLFMVGIIIHFAGARVIHKTLPPVVTGAVVMLIGFNLAPVVANEYWVQDPWLAFIVMLIVVALSVGLRGFLGRVAIFLSLIIGYVLAWGFDRMFGQASFVYHGEPKSAWRVDWTKVAEQPWFGLPRLTDLSAPWHPGAADNLVGLHLPQFNLAAILVALPVVIALIAENTGHVKAVAEMTGENLDPVMGKAIAADGAGSALATLVGAGPTTTYAENIGVMAATKVYSTAAYVVAALVAIGFGFSPKLGAIISATPGAVLGGITVVLYGMIGLLGAKIWKENKVDLGNPINLIPAAAGIIIGIGDLNLTIGDFSLGGIALGTIVVVTVYHLARTIAPRELREQADGASIIYDAPGIYTEEDDEDPRPS